MLIMDDGMEKAMNNQNQQHGNPLLISPKRLVLGMIFRVLYIVLLAACTAQEPVGRDLIHLPLPILTCQQENVEWNGLVAGESTRQQVLDVLGQPDKDQIVQRVNIKIQMYAYDVNSPFLQTFPNVKHRIYFRSDDVIDWMEIVVADTDEAWHPIWEYGDNLGYEIDLAYFNNNSEYGFIDVESLPEKIYVWSECGVALNAFPQCTGDLQLYLQCEPVYEQNPDRAFSRRQFTQGVVPTVLAEPNPNDIVMIKYLFPPTTYDGFGTYYGDLIPFDTWYYYWYPDLPMVDPI